MISHLNRFVNNGAGLEKTLRLIQSSAQVAAVFTVGSTAVRLTTAKLQLALSTYLDLQLDPPSDLQLTNYISEAILPLLRLHRVLPAGIGPARQRRDGICVRLVGAGQVDMFRSVLCTGGSDHCT